MNLGQLVEHVRLYYLRDTESPYLWPAKELVRYFNGAQDIFARHTHCITDSESDFTLISTTASKNNYRLDPRIVYVYEIYNGYGRRMNRSNRQKIPTATNQGVPTAYTLDAGSSVLRFWPTPDAVYEYKLVVARRPLRDMAATHDVPEIPEEYHLDLCDYVAYMAVRNNDTESSDVQAGGNFRDDWERKLLDAKRHFYHLRGGSNQHAVNNWTASCGR
jgi:hypothetical protein